MAHQKAALKGESRSTLASLFMWLAAAVGAPSAIAVFTWHTILKHPIMGAALLVAVALLIGVIWLLSELWRRSYRDKFLDWVSAGLDRGTARFGKHYRQYLLNDLRYIYLKGMGGRFYTPELDEVYVDVALRPRDPLNVPSSDLSDTDFIDLLIAKPVIARTERPASAKVRMLRIMALCLAAYADDSQRDIPSKLTAGGNKFREIAAVITWLERRHAGATEPVETILLALNWVL